MFKKLRLLFKKQKEHYNSTISYSRNIIVEPSFDSNLFTQYGPSRSFENHITVLAISDTHLCLDEAEFVSFLNANPEYDICVLLGDHHRNDLNIILKYIDASRIYALLGNHDADYITQLGFKNLNGNIYCVKGVSFTGIQGCFKYKNHDFPSFTQEQSQEFMADLEPVDILFSHDNRYTERSSNPAHQGLKGINEYIFKNHIPVHIHGHIHKNYTNVLINGTIEHSVFMFKLIKL